MHGTNDVDKKKCTIQCASCAQILGTALQMHVLPFAILLVPEHLCSMLKNGTTGYRHVLREPYI